jgi:hypothetical protein
MHVKTAKRRASKALRAVIRAAGSYIEAEQALEEAVRAESGVPLRGSPSRRPAARPLQRLRAPSLSREGAQP